MPTVAYNEIAEYVNRRGADPWPAVSLLYGEELLCKNAFHLVMGKLMPESEQTVGVETFDGSEASVGAVLASLNTHALFSRTKVVVLHNARLFYSADARQGLREQMIRAGESGQIGKASRFLLNLMALEGLDFADLQIAKHRRKCVADADGQPPAWFLQLLDHCREKGLAPPDKRDDATLLKAAMDEGFPHGHHLLITADVVDRRKALYKALDAHGLVVDCTVPKGATRNDRLSREAVLSAAIDEALAVADKQMTADARRRMIRFTGFDLHTLVGNVEKLASYVGKRRTIADEDVTTVLRRTRKDPIYAFTNAVADRNLPEALVLMQRLLGERMHPLQLLAAVANQLRRLLVARAYIARDRGRSWSARMAFPQFKARAFHEVQAADQAFAGLQQTWDAMLTPAAGKAKGRKTAASDLVLAKNPRSPFPVFQTLKQANHFSLEELIAALVDLSDTDRRMKSTGQDPRLLLEAHLIRLCRPDRGSANHRASGSVSAPAGQRHRPLNT